MTGLPLTDYGVVGDMETLALVSRAGGVDWLCWPRFDSPSVFGRLLDADGGHWCIEPVEEPTATRHLYLPGSNILLTRFHTPEAVVEIEDYMVIDGRRQLARRVRCQRGSITMRSEMVPRPDYGRIDVEIEAADVGYSIGIGASEPLWTNADVPLELDGATLRSEFRLTEGDVVSFVLGTTTDLDDDCGYARTLAYWQDWLGQSRYRGRRREAVERSALALKLLTHDRSGGVLAAGTTSLPEAIGGERNYDYRYVWIRDAAFTLYALLELGFGSEADAFTHWLLDRLEASAGDGEEHPLSPLYDLDGNSDLDEIELDHWSGYRDSRPVRVGNAASGQFQLDIYGELIDSLYLADKHGDGLHLDAWRQVQRLVDWVIDHHEEPDEGMWETRGGRQRFTSSLLLSWVAVERAIRMARHRGRPADLGRWMSARDRMHETLLDRGWNDEIGSFVQTLDGDAVDASLLLAPLVKFVPSSDPRWRSTLAVIEERLGHGPLVDRYDQERFDDGFDGPEGSFVMCSFWFVEALARAGEAGRASELFDRLLTYSGPLGLFSEEIGVDGRLLGNYPQAFSHLALISAAVALDEAFDEA